MILSILRDSLRADGLYIPARPSIESTQFVMYKKSRNGNSSSGVYRITLAEQQEKKTTTWKGLLHNNNISESCGSSASAIVRLEIVGCIQKLSRPYITGWKQIAAVDLTLPNKKSKLGNTAMMEQQEDDDIARKNVKKSVKIGGVICDK